MANTRTVRTSDGMVISGVPKSMTQDQGERFANLLRRSSPGGFQGSYQQALSTIDRGASAGVSAPQESQRAPGIATAPQPMEEQITTDSTLTGAVGGATREMAPVAAGTLLGAGLGSVVPGVGTAAGALGGAAITGIAVPVMDAVVTTANNLFDKDYTTPTEAMNDLLTRAGVDQAETSGERVAAALASGVTDAGVTVGLGKILQSFGPELGETLLKRIGQVLSADAATEVGGSVGAEVAAQGMGEAVADSDLSEGAKSALTLGAGIAGGTVGAGLASPVSRIQAAEGTPLTTAQRVAIEEGQRFGAEPTTSDILSDTSARAAARQKHGVEARGGTAQRSYDINTARVRRVDDFGREYGVEIGGLGGTDNVSREIAQNFLENRQDQVYTWASRKRDVIEKLSGETIPDYVVEVDPELGTTFTVSRGGAPLDGAPDITAKVDPVTAKVDVDGTIQIIEDARAQMIEDGLSSDNKVINLITDWEQAIQDKNLAAIERIRRKISNEWTDPNASIGKDEKALYRRIYSSLNEDMGNFIKQEGTQADYNQWRVANNNLSSLMDDFNVSGLNTAIREGQASPNMVTRLLWDQEPERVKDIYAGLDEEGKRRAKTALVSRMLEGSQTADGKLSGNAFAQQLRSFREPIEVAFSGTERAQMEGLKKWLNSTSFHEAVVSSATGQRTPNINIAPGMGPVVAGAARANPAAVLAVSSAGVGLRGKFYQLYESPQARDLMIQLANTDPGTTKSEALAKRLNEMFSGAAEASERVEETPPTDEEARREWIRQRVAEERRVR